MRTLFAMLYILMSVSAFAQGGNFAALLKAGKAEFNKETDDQDYKVAVENLEKAVKLKPTNAEAHYFLGYAYSRLNAKDAKGMADMNLGLVLKCSEEFETVNKLTPKYEGEILVLDPYSKLSAEWGSMAMSYWHNNKSDSVLWCFKEGKKRGGFSDFYLAIGRSALGLCGDSAILVSSGDNITFSLWYLQVVEAIRKDVSVVDVNLLGTTWYAKDLWKKGLASFDLPSEILDTVEYRKWDDSTVAIGDFKWKLLPSYADEYLLRGDLVFLSLLRGNNFKRGVYFTTGFAEDSRLSLKEYLTPLILIDRLDIENPHEPSYDKYRTQITKTLMLVEKVNWNNPQEWNFVDNIRYNLLAHVEADKTNKKRVAELLDLMEKYASDKKYPFNSEEGKKIRGLCAQAALSTIKIWMKLF